MSVEAIGELGQVGSQFAHSDYFLESSGVFRETEEDVLSHSGREDAGLLLHQGYSTLRSDFALL